MSTKRRTNSDRVRSEVSHDPGSRHRQIGRAVHETMAMLAGRDSMIDIDDIDAAVVAVLRAHPINAPKYLSRPLSAITTHAAMGVRLLPPLAWKLHDAELDLPSGSRIDLVFGSDVLVTVGEDHIGDIIGIEIKQAASVDTAHLADTVEQVNKHLDGLIELYGDRVIGVVTLCLGHHSRSVLTLNAPDRPVIPYADTDLCTFPHGRLN